MDEIYGVYEKWKESGERDWWEMDMFKGRMLDINFWYLDDDIHDVWAVTIYKCLFNAKEGYWVTNVTDGYMSLTYKFKNYLKERESNNAT
jgi:hypothetical protein